MAIKYASWVHGHSAQIQGPFDVVRRFGWGIQVDPGGPNACWLHYAIPTPTILDGKHLKLDSVIVRFKTVESGMILKVHIWDGERRIHADDQLKWRSQDNYKSEKIALRDKPQITWGVGVSISFGNALPIEPRALDVWIAAIGIDFVE